MSATTTGAGGALKGALYGTGRLPGGLQHSRSAPTLLPALNAGASSSAPASKKEKVLGVSMDALMKFLFPARLENPDSCGRLEVFGKYGPTDEDGNLRGGVNGHHIHGDLEVKQMVEHSCREALFKMFLPKDRSTVESTVDTLMPTAMSHRYTQSEITQMLRNVRRYPGTERMIFDSLQETIAASQKKRLGEMARRAMSGEPIKPPKENPLKVPFQSRPCYELMAVTRKKKHGFMESEISKSKKLHAYASLCASLEDQPLTEQVMMNCNMCRNLGRLDDRWDRYCALRRTGRSSYVQTRNTYRFNPSMDCGLGNKHPSISSLLTASCAGSSAGALLGAS